jgi:flagellar basal-body rod protein FlgG
MNAAMYKALSGAIVQTRRLEVVTQDLANTNTPGYKGERLVFREMLEAPTKSEDHIGGQVVVTEQHTDFSEGSIRHTGNPLDLAILGEGFFAVQTPRGVRYTRQGIFTLSAEKTLVTSSGESLLGEGGPIRVDGNTIDITNEGKVFVDGEEVASLRIVRAKDPRRLVREGYTFFRLEDDEAEEVKDIRLEPGSVEEANINPIESMAALIDISRQFEAYERAMRTIDSATEKAVNEAGKL